MELKTISHVEFESLKAHDPVPEEQVYFYLFMLTLKYWNTLR